MCLSPSFLRKATPFEPLNTESVFNIRFRDPKETMNRILFPDGAPRRKWVTEETLAPAAGPSRAGPPLACVVEMALGK